MSDPIDVAAVRARLLADCGPCAAVRDVLAALDQLQRENERLTDDRDWVRLERDDARAERDAALARAEAAEQERDRLRAFVQSF